MLYGTLKQQQDVIEQAQKYAEAAGMKLIFGAMVGSVSKGLHYADSDYDTRFLYLREDFPDKICIPAEMKEEELVKRYYPKDKIYEWIPFWEATSFFQFLDNPSFKDDFSVGLYNIVGWTLQSPYVWDPFGLQSKIMPLLNMIFKKEYEIAYHRTILNKYEDEWEKELVIAKSYLYSVHAAATIEWSVRYNLQPPIDLQTLLCGLNRQDIWCESYKILIDARRKVKKKSQSEEVKLHGSHFDVMTLYNSKISNYIKMISSNVELKDIEQEQNDRSKWVLDDIYKIIYSSVYEREELLYADKT